MDKIVETKERKRAMDPWIKNLDLGSLLRYLFRLNNFDYYESHILSFFLFREYALLTGSMTDSARQIRYPLLLRDDGLLQRGLEKQAR